MPAPLAEDSTIVFLSPSGWGNLGDAAILDSLVHAVRRRLPRARLLGFTLNPAETSRQHGVEAETLLGYSAPFYNMAASVAGLGEPQWRPLSALRQLPLGGLARSVAVAPLRVLREVPHLRASLRRVRGAAAVVVAGGGQLDDVFGGAWGQPWTLFRWGRIARAAGARFIVASVGTGSLSSAPSRFLVRRALELADYRSFRDDRSRELVGAPRLTASDPIVPDLAYGCPAQTAPAPAGERWVVGISPMAWNDPGVWPVADRRRYNGHVRSFGALAASLLRAGHRVILFTTSREPRAVADTRSAVPEDLRERLEVAEPPSVEELFRVYAQLDFVVAARLHGALLAHVAGRPVMAVSHERKVRTLMDDQGQGRFCMEIDAFDPAEGASRLAELAGRRVELSRQIDATAAANRARVEAQYDALFGPARS